MQYPKQPGRPPKADFRIWTDGGCVPNPGPGAWAYLIRVPGQPDIEHARFSPDTTNNRMEICAAIGALERFKTLNLSGRVLVYSDSKHLVFAMTEWIHRWKVSDWRNSERKPVLNMDLWMRLDRISQIIQPKWWWVKSHNGQPENERVDFLATQCRLDNLNLRRAG